MPTRGGTALGLKAGVFDQREIEQRQDVLVYTGETLASDLEVTGPVTMILYAASSAPDTDFTAKLCDVRPDGYAQNIVEGVVRARFRDSLAAPSPIVPERVYEYRLDLWATSHLFKLGIACASRSRRVIFHVTIEIPTAGTIYSPTLSSRGRIRASSTTAAMALV